MKNGNKHASCSNNVKMKLPIAISLSVAFWSTFYQFKRVPTNEHTLLHLSSIYSSISISFWMSSMIVRSSHYNKLKCFSMYKMVIESTTKSIGLTKETIAVSDTWFDWAFFSHLIRREGVNQWCTDVFTLQRTNTYTSNRWKRQHLYRHSSRTHSNDCIDSFFRSRSSIVVVVVYSYKTDFSLQSSPT